ncbi:MAG: hypothetical protein WBY44_28715 [Bryobacteraceae bacterium]
MATENEKNRLLRRSRKDYEKAKADNLTAFLNTADIGASAQRSFAMEIFGLCQQLQDASEESPERLAGTFRAVNACLDHFRFKPALYRPHDRYVAVQWRPDEQRQGTAVPLTGAVIGRIGPTAAIKLMLDMVEDGSFDRIRKCICGQWFFAQSKKRLTCSDPCRLRKFKEDRGGKYDRTEYMREYRKNPKVKAKRRKRARKTK